MAAAYDFVFFPSRFVFLVWYATRVQRDGRSLGAKVFNLCPVVFYFSGVNVVLFR